LPLDRRILANINWWLILLVMILCFAGIVNIYSATADSDSQAIRSAPRLQTRWVGIGLVVMFFVMALDYNRLVKGAFLLHFMGCIGLLAVLFFPCEAAGVRRWLNLGIVRFQPSEIVKVTTVLALVRLFSAEQLQMRPWLKLLGGLGIVAVPAALILKQPDLGTAAMLFVPLLFISLVGLSRLKPLLITAVAGAFCSIPGWFMLKDYQQRRLIAFFNPGYDELGAGYQAIQSRIAVGSGGVWGKGFHRGTQVRLQFVPAQHTDFVFSVHAEEHGLVGSTLVMLVMVVITAIGVSIAVRAKDKAGLLLALGCTSVIAGQFLTNVAMVVGFLPITGLPLPFMSYGGSSILAMFAMVGLIESVNMRRFAF